ncbi:hypothetical protein DFH08DRAFT_864588 [Mycena albidolilacea]|uniref:F-box domain-containing protein n=1 Tax=Mycena albidolilacea TaxID=1033008 RepID=A0AAD7ES32_9AGAR|nr:hypothetical protein DFH08DRAFT_864588 [Mycena albidolilacea]
MSQVNVASELAERPATQCPDCARTHSLRTLIPSPFQCIIARELMPTASETAAIREFVLETDAEIARRERDINRPRCEVVELRRRAEQHKAILAPIRRVPPEILAEIFLQLADIERFWGRSHNYYNDGEIFEKEYLTRPSLRTAPLIFGQISRKWRAVALSIPSLWNRISLKCTDKKMENNISLCNMWLKRSGALPLFFQFHRLIYFPSDVVSPKLVDDYRVLLRTILPHAKRWRSVDLENFPASSYKVLHDLLPNSVLVLEALSVRYDSREQPALVSTPWAGLHIAPKLRLLDFSSIRGAEIIVGGERPTFPWSQLTHIDVGDCSAYDCLRILGQALTAVACKFAVKHPSPLQHPPVSHSGLRTFKLKYDGDVFLLWSCLTCPLLSTLAIEKQVFSSNISLRGLPSFIARSGATIENFTLDSSSFDDTQFMASLTEMPRLRRLCVLEHGTGTQFTDAVWGSLTSNSPSPLVPDLESLRLEGATGFSHKSVVRMLESRVRTADSPADFVPKLKVVSITIFRNMSQSALSRLMEFEKFGLEIGVDVYSYNEEEEDGSEASDAESESEADGEESDEEDV